MFKLKNKRIKIMDFFKSDGQNVSVKKYRIKITF